YSLSSRALRAGAWIAGGILMTILAFTFGIGLDGTGRVRAAVLEIKNRTLETELASFQERVEALETSLDRLAANDPQFRSIAGLEPIEPEVLQAGVGGPGLGSLEQSALWPVDSATSKVLFAASYDLDALERRTHLLAASLEEATDSVLAHRDLLESTPSILPTPGWVSSSYSRARMHPVHNRPLPHHGVDI